jgi:hypothetical protein
MKNLFVVSAVTENHFFNTIEEAKKDFQCGVETCKKEKISGTIYLYEIPAQIENEDNYLSHNDKDKHFHLCLENETAKEIEKIIF